VPGKRQSAAVALSQEVKQGAAQRGRVRLSTVRNSGGRKAARVLGRVTANLGPTPLTGLCGIADAMPLTAEQMILNYSQGLFPMDYGGRLRWHYPDPRFVLYLDELRLSSKMRRDLRKSDFTFSLDREPRQVLDGCADRPGNSWLSNRLKRVFLDLFELGGMHSAEAWQGEHLVGGSFGLSIGQVFSIESMFNRAPNASKALLVHLIGYLRERDYVCIDGQEYSEHFARLGAREIPAAQYRDVMARGLVKPALFRDEGEPGENPPPSTDQDPA
jgi:leucyl/phenylalanyl-tRNA--protein transferase